MKDVKLLIIDVQHDFVVPDELDTGGARKDAERLAGFILKNACLVKPLDLTGLCDPDRLAPLPLNAPPRGR